MKKLLLVYLPFCTPASPPYSVTSMYSFLKNNSSIEIEVLDLNILFHSKKFSEYQKYFQDQSKWNNYEERCKEYQKETSKVYSENNKAVVDGNKPELFEELLQKIIDSKADIVAFSIVYSSQAFYCHALLKELQKLKVKTIVGGPAVNEKLIDLADEHLKNEIELLEFIENKKIKHDDLNFKTIPDFSIYNLEEYFVPAPVIPLKTSSTCYYKQCTFCDHFAKVPYHETNLEIIKETITKSKQKHFFLIDDMIPTNRLLQLAEVFKEHNAFWTCQLKPTNQLTSDVLKTLHESGLTMIILGVESGNQRVLDLMKKGTNLPDVQFVLKNSHEAGIKNVTYIMFGFPTETKEEALDTVHMLSDNSEYVDLISLSVFGLQHGTPVYKNPEAFGITNVVEEERTVLEPKITYEVSSGMNQKEATRFKDNHRKMLDGINKFPNSMNFFREHMFCLVSK